MSDKLCFGEWKIGKISDDEDRFGNPIKMASIGVRAIGTEIPLYENDLLLLQTILGCDFNHLQGKKITAVYKARIVKAIGYQGLYIPLYYSDNSSKLLSESELCELLDCYEVIRIDENGEQIASYEVPTYCSKRSI